MNENIYVHKSSYLRVRRFFVLNKFEGAVNNNEYVRRVQRGYMAKSMEVEKFLNMIIETLSKEFEKEVKLEEMGEGQIRIVIDSYEVRTSMSYLEEIKSPYGIDRFILESLEKEGFIFDRNRSQYIQYCFGIYNGMK
ncbi:hypothetical protein [Clostridium tagluense]|uniref:hypothetical protein n=1 Tax=Clostridium tagluense TaxID=360422 RepID=UPI001CF473CD|nr:hypothetical protein [Clostridium tagluense]MCB2298879.1 hypothetical protein [Clostridium tagluense]